VVSFTKVDDAGRSTVDTPIKKGIARAQFAVFRAGADFQWHAAWCWERNFREGEP